MTAGAADELSALYWLARLCGVDVPDEPATISPGLLLAALRDLGVPIEDVAAAPMVFDAHRREIWDWRLEPVTVAWDGVGNAVLRMPADFAHLRIDCNMRLEEGEGHGWGVNLTDVPPFESEEIAGELYFAKLLPLRRLPFGYQRLYVDLPGHHTEALVISAPATAFHVERRSDSVLLLGPMTGTNGRPAGPLQQRRTGYEALIAYLRSNVTEGSTIEIEELASWFRPYLPIAAARGAPLRYEVEEILALLCVESHRNQAVISFGVSAGLAPEIAAALRRHGFVPQDTEPPDDGSVGYPNWRRRIEPAIEDLDSSTQPSGVLELLRERRP